MPIGETVHGALSAERSERGQVAGLEAMAFGTLVLIVGILLIANAWGVIDAEAAARTAAREGAHAYAKAAGTTSSEAAAVADRAATETLDQLGWSGGRVGAHAVFVRCHLVTYVVTVLVPVLRLPWLNAGPALVRATAHHTERVDPYRSGVPDGAANCGAG
ncbi:MAG: hypothetical protein ACYDH6_18320 [Acidimicrobiales bacterium]